MPITMTLLEVSIFENQFIITPILYFDTEKLFPTGGITTHQL